MIKVSVFYPNGPSAKFDIDYYCTKHMALVQGLLGKALKGMAVDHGIAGGMPGVPAPFIAIGHLVFDSVEAFQSSFGPHSPAIFSDVPNYTNAQAMIQVSEIKM